MSAADKGLATGLARGMATGKPANEAAEFPFWFDLWQNRGWSRRVARNWRMDAAFRDHDRGFLDIVLPTLAPDQKDYVMDVLRHEGHR